MHRSIPAALVALALAAGACAGPAPDKAAAGAGEKAQAAEKQPWWRLSQYSRERVLTPEERYRKRPGLFSGKDGEFVLYRKGEAGRSSDPSKPTKLKR